MRDQVFDVWRVFWHLVVLLGVVLPSEGVNLRPWEEVRKTLDAKSLVSRPDLMDLTWRNGGGPEGRVMKENAVLDWKIRIDHRSGGSYPVGWPSFEARPCPTKDLSGFGAIAFEARALKDVGHEQTVRFILKHGDSQAINVPFTVSVGSWRTVVVPLPRQDWLKDVDRVHFFICESDYAHGEELDFQFRDFRLGTMTQELVPLADGLAGATLWVGARADADSRVVKLPVGTPTLPAVLHLENRLPRELPAMAEVRFRLHDVFTGQETVQSVLLAQAVAPKTRARVPLTIDLKGLPPSYFHVLADVLVEGVSVLDVRKGSDDFYLAAPGESETYSMLSLRTGMAAWAMDRIYGGFLHSVDIALPHAYDPFDVDPKAYGAFLRVFAQNTSKVCEGYEAGMPGLALAAEAFRRTGDQTRTAFAERLLENSCEAMLSMQDDCGGVVTQMNELHAHGLGKGWGSEPRNAQYSCDQTSEWMRGLAYATFYYQRRGGAGEKVRRLNAACRKAGDFVLANCLEDSDGIPGVIRNFSLTLVTNGVRRMAYRQEGRRCDVYQPRILAGLSYTAIALLQDGETVPESWWAAFDHSVDWITRKMKPNGWFDWQCADVVEGGCHTFLGNIYAGEGLFGAGLANRLAGRDKASGGAFAAARKAYRYVTDDCYIRGHRYQYPLEFWVGPYVYWLFTEWNRTVDPEPVFTDWLVTLDCKWRLEREWGDFTRKPGMNCGRANYNGMLTLAILGYLGLRQMDEINQPWTFVDVKGVAQ